MNEDLLWKRVLKRVKNEINSLVYATWFEPTKLKINDDGKVVILVPTKIHKKHLSENYYDMIIDCLLTETNEVDEISFALEDEFVTDKEETEYVARHVKNVLN